MAQRKYNYNGDNNEADFGTRVKEGTTRAEPGLCEGQEPATEAPWCSLDYLVRLTVRVIVAGWLLISFAVSWLRNGHVT